MFHIYEGFHLVETYHKMRHQRKYHPEDSTKRVLKIALVAIVTLLLWNIPTEWYGIQNLTIVQQRISSSVALYWLSLPRRQDSTPNWQKYCWLLSVQEVRWCCWVSSW